MEKGCFTEHKFTKKGFYFKKTSHGKSLSTKKAHIVTNFLSSYSIILYLSGEGVGMYTYICPYACREQRSVLRVLLYCSSPYAMAYGPSLKRTASCPWTRA